MKKILAIIAVGLVCIGWGASGGGGAGTDTTAIHDDTAGEIAAIATVDSVANGDFVLIEDITDGNAKKKVTVSNLAAGGAAPAGATYLTGTDDGTLTDEIVVGLVPGGDLAGSTWAAPLVGSPLTAYGWSMATPTFGLNNGAVTLTFNTSSTDTVFVVGPTGTGTYGGILSSDGLTMGINEPLTLGPQTLLHDGTDFQMNDSIIVDGTVATDAVTVGDGSAGTSVLTFGVSGSNTALTAGNGVLGYDGGLTVDNGLTLGDGAINSQTLTFEVGGTDSTLTAGSDSLVYSGAFTADSFSSIASAGTAGAIALKMPAGTTQLGQGFGGIGTTATQTFFGFYGSDQAMLDPGMVLSINDAGTDVNYGGTIGWVKTYGVTPTYNSAIKQISQSSLYTMPITETLNNTTVYTGAAMTINLPDISLAAKHVNGGGVPTVHVLSEANAVVTVNPSDSDWIRMNGVLLDAGDSIDSPAFQSCEVDCQASTYTQRWYCTAITCTWVDGG